MDIHLPGENGIAISRRILVEYPAVKIIALSSDSRLALINEALQAGLSAFVRKESNSEEMVRAIRSVLDNRVYLCPDVASMVVADYMNTIGEKTVSESKPTLTDRESLLLKLVAEGRRNKEIAEALDVEVKSVETFRSRLMKKLGCASSNELTRYAIREGYITP